MNDMFDSCAGLKTLYLRGWNVMNVTKFDKMFVHCESLVTLDLSGWKININNHDLTYGDMFNVCKSLKTVKMIGCDENTVNFIKARLRDVKISDDIVVTTE